MESPSKSVCLGFVCRLSTGMPVIMKPWLDLRIAAGCRLHVLPTTPAGGWTLDLSSGRNSFSLIQRMGLGDGTTPYQQRLSPLLHSSICMYLGQQLP